ncbi:MULTISPECIES: hypothetical protein [Methylosinus]|uniref:hypothetical protein n=1 Tax=Methylosinus TaxID=425 RepID=UPI0001D2E4C3|nr:MULTISPECIES: hypothetical protein [Methylosinus]OBS51462.1 hypothetical protein A8B73_16215 [Methylosinus sp. 3S-1]
MDDKDRPPTSDRLRIDIDHGLAADKVAAPDPTAAPLGTDDEAGGAPPTAEQRALAAAHENRARYMQQSDTRLLAGRTLAVVLFAVVAIASLLLLIATR